MQGTIEERAYEMFCAWCEKHHITEHFLDAWISMTPRGKGHWLMIAEREPAPTLVAPTWGMAKPNRAGRQTRAGGQGMQGVLEQALVAAGLRNYETNVNVTAIGHGANATVLQADYRIATNTGSVLVKLMWQASSGSAEWKFPWHLITLAKAVKDGNGDRAYMALGGDKGWRYKGLFLSGEVNDYIVGGELVTVEDFAAFIKRVNAGLL